MTASATDRPTTTTRPEALDGHPAPPTEERPATGAPRRPAWPWLVGAAALALAVLTVALLAVAVSRTTTALPSDGSWERAEEARMARLAPTTSDDSSERAEAARMLRLAPRRG